MDSKVHTLKEMRSWDEISRPNGTKVLHTKLVLKHKNHETGHIQERKARLLVCGNGGVANDEIYSQWFMTLQL